LTNTAPAALGVWFLAGFSFRSHAAEHPRLRPAQSIYLNHADDGSAFITWQFDVAAVYGHDHAAAAIDAGDRLLRSLPSDRVAESGF
jgi:hypothetical protein